MEMQLNPQDPRSLSVVDDLISLRGLGLQVTEIGIASPEATGPGVIRVGVHRAGRLPDAAVCEAFDILLSSDRGAPQPWVGVDDIDEALLDLSIGVDGQPLASAVAIQVLRMTLKVSFEEALILESLAYSMLLASAPFRTWRHANPARRRNEPSPSRVALEVTDREIGVRLLRPDARNAVDARMRDALAEAFDFALADPERRSVFLSGEGPAFSAGGDLNEFGLFHDPGEAHAVRTLRSVTGRIAAMSSRVTSHLHGACIGAGIEMPAAARKILAAPDTIFRLPEVSMGLIPGAGGTASISRRIGRHRTAWMTVTGKHLDCATALSWGLVDVVSHDPSGVLREVSA